MEEKSANSDDSEYQMVLTTLDELKLASLKPFFKSHQLEDDTLFYMKSEDELKSELKKLGLPFGQAFKFSRHWFIKYHTHPAINSKKSGDDNQNAQLEEVLSKATPCSRNLQEDAERSGLKETQDSAKNNEALVSCDVRETTDSVGPDKLKPLQGEKEDLLGTHCSLEQPHISIQAKDEYKGLSSASVEGTFLEKGLTGPGQKAAALNGNNSAVSIGSTQRDDRNAEYENMGPISDNVLRSIPSNDTNNNYMAEKTSISDTASVASQSVGTAVTEKPNQSVEKVSSVASSSSMPQTAGLPAISNQKGKAKSQSLSPEGQNVQSVQVSKCIGRPFGVKVAENNISYKKGSVLAAEENKEVEYKSFSSAHPSILPWKIMEKAKKFICACLNAGSKGIIYFGVGDNQEQGSKFHHGEVIGLEVENIKDDIIKALQCLLDNHIQSDDGALQKGGEQNCIDIHFVPVKCQEDCANLYVVEVEVSRDWRFCKDNVYHSKSWIEKPEGSKDPTRKKGLNELFKVKDALDDVAVRTKGASICVKQHEVKRQVRDPLVTKYEEWKGEAKFVASEFTDGQNPDDPDFKRFNKMVRERLFDLNTKEYHYILVANKVPPQYRGTPHLSFLQSIPWVAVFDLFDDSSKTDGLHFICNEMTDARRANIKTLDDFKDISSDWTANEDCPLSTRGTTWILQLKKLQDEEWITCSAKDCFYRALSAYKQCFPSGRLIIAILGLGENAIMEMSDIAESCFSILGGDIARKCVTIISESKVILDLFKKNSKPALRKQLMDCSIPEMSWNLLKEIVREMVGPTEFKERGATTKLPHITGQREVLNKVIHSWEDLEVYCPEPQVSKLTEDIEKARDAFYKGTQASQTNLFYKHAIERTLEEEITQKIEQAVKFLGKPSSDRIGSVKTVTVPYEPGSGATTLCRRILWNKRKEYRCAVVKAITKTTDFQIEQLQGICYYEKQQNYAHPVLVLVDNFPEFDTLGLSERLIKRETKCVIIATYPVETTGTTIAFEINPLRQLDDNEMSHVRNILINITRDSGRRREAEEVLEREKRFIWFGLELFGREYVKIKERLQNHIKSTLAFLCDSHAIYEKLLTFCCFLHFYSNGADILPHSFVADFLYEESVDTDKKFAQMASIHEKFGGLLLEEFNEYYGYHGWRPAHSLVSEVVKSRMNADEIAVQLLENAEKGKAYANKFLWENLFQILLHRKRVSNLISLPQETPEDNIDSDIAADDQKCYEVRTRYSPLILDILGGDDGQRRTLELLMTVCQKANQTADKAYAWQQLARFMGYEMRFKQLESKDALHSRLYEAMNLSKVKEHQLPMPETGIKAAHIAIDIAIDQEPSYSHHYTTKGVLYVLQLRDVNTEDEHNLVSSMSDVIDIGRKALKVYDQAIQQKHGLNFYSVIGKTQVIVLLLKIFKSLPCFCLENNSFTRYLEFGEIPREMVDFLQQKDHKFVQNLGRTTLELLNELFKDVKYRQLTTCDENELRNLSSANTRACKLREEFYDITGFDRREAVPTEMPLSLSSKGAPDILQNVVQDILFKNNETPYSGWYNLGSQVISSIYRLLKPLCLESNGNHNDMLIFSRVCIRLPRQEKPTVEELNNVVQTWITKFPDSAWAHLFNYMIHFPIPNRSLLATNLAALASINKCCEMVQKRTGRRARKSAAEYFLGKGTGLTTIVSRQEFPELEKKWWKTKTDFWRSKEVSETLIRVRGQKLSPGVITYQGIQLPFDDMLYPNESKDDLWFYVGFSVAGPYAFDPVDEDNYSIMARKRAKRAVNTRSFKGASNVVRRGAGSGRRKPHVRGSGIKRNPDFPTTSLVKNVREKLPGRHFNVPPGFVNNSPCSRTTALLTRSPLVGDDSLQRPKTTAAPPSCVSPLKHGVASQEKELPNADRQPPEASGAQEGALCYVGAGVVSVVSQTSRKPRGKGRGIQRNPYDSEDRPTTSPVQNYPEQLPNKHFNVPKGLMNSSSCSKSITLQTRSPLASDDNHQRPAAGAIPPFFESALKHGEGNHEKVKANDGSQPPDSSVSQKGASNGIVSGAVSVPGQASRKPRGRGRGIQRNPHASGDWLTISHVQNFREQLLRGFMNSFPYSRSTALSTISPLASGDNPPRSAGTAIPPSCSSELQHEGGVQEKEIPSADNQQPEASVAQKGTSSTVGHGAVSVTGQDSYKLRGMSRGIKRNARALGDCSTASLVQNFRVQLPNDHFNVPRVFMNSSGYTAPLTRSPMASNENIQRPAAAAIPPSYASELKQGGASQEKEIPNADSQVPEATVAQKGDSNAVVPGFVSVAGQVNRNSLGISRVIQRNPDASEDCLNTSVVQNFRDQLPSEHFNVPREFMNSSVCSRPTAFLTRSPLVSDDNLQSPAATVIPPSDASKVKHEGASRKREMPKAERQPPEVSTEQKSASSAVGPGAVSEMDSGIQRNPDASEDCFTISLVQNVWEQITSENFNVPKMVMTSSPCSESTSLTTISSVAIDSNLQRPAVNAIPHSYASALKHRRASQEKEISNADREPSEALATQNAINRKCITVTRGEQTRVFQPSYVDNKGKLHHGSRVLGAFKSQECRIHTSTISLHDLDHCTFAHSWRGDTIQSVCTKCTEDNKPVCREKKEHQQFIWKLGPYYTEYGNIWKDSSGQEH